MADFPEMLPDHFLKLKAIRARMRDLTPHERSFIETIVDNKPLDDDQAFMLNQVYNNLKDSAEFLLPKDHGIHEVESFESCGRTA